MVTEAANLTNLTGMTAVSAFGEPLIILGLLVGGGLYAAAGVRGRLQGASLADMLSVIGSVVLVIVSLSLFESVITYTNTLIGEVASGFGDVVYGIIPLIIYPGIFIGGIMAFGAAGSWWMPGIDGFFMSAFSSAFPAKDRIRCHSFLLIIRIRPCCP